MKPFAIILQVVSGLLLLVYPFVLMANLMTMGAPANAEGYKGLFLSIFMIGTTIYPIVFLVATFFAWRALNQNNLTMGAILSGAPLLFLGLLIIFAVLSA